jgi:hypothetical protein
MFGGGATTFVYRRRKIFSDAPAAAQRPETRDPNFTPSVQYSFATLLV